MRTSNSTPVYLQLAPDVRVVEFGADLRGKSVHFLDVLSDFGRVGRDDLRDPVVIHRRAGRSGRVSVQVSRSASAAEIAASVAHFTAFLSLLYFPG